MTVEDGQLLLRCFASNISMVCTFSCLKSGRQSFGRHFSRLEREWLFDISSGFVFQVFSQTFVFSSSSSIREGEFPVIAKITRILTANICRQFFFVINTAASSCCLVENFQPICYSQRVNATSQYNDSGSSRCSKWLNDRTVPVVNIVGSLYKEKDAAEKDD